MRVSDLSGMELDDSQVVTVNVKNAGKIFDASVEELKALKTVNNVMELELRYPSGQVSTALVMKAEFQKLVPDDKLESFPSNRGRRPGFSPRMNGSPV